MGRGSRGGVTRSLAVVSLRMDLTYRERDLILRGLFELTIT